MSSKKPPRPKVNRYRKDPRSSKLAPSPKPPSSRDSQILDTRSYVKGGLDRLPRRSKKPPTDPNEEALQKRSERYEEQRRELENLIKILRQIGGSDQLINILQLHNDAQLVILEGEVLSQKLKAEAVETWKILDRLIHSDQRGKPEITFENLRELVQALEPRTKTDEDFGPTENPRSIPPREVERSLETNKSKILKGVDEVRGIDPNNKYVYQATTSGRNGIKETIELATEALKGMSEDQLAMVLLHYRVLKTGTVETHSTASGARNDIENIINDGKARELGTKMIGLRLNRANVKQGMDETAKQGHELAQSIILILRMMDQEAEVADLLATIVPTKELPKLRQSIEKDSPSGPERGLALKTVDRAILLRKTKAKKRPLPGALQRGLD